MMTTVLLMIRMTSVLLMISDDQGAPDDHDDEGDESDELSVKLLKLFNFSFSCAGDRSTVSCMPRWAIIIHKFVGADSLMRLMMLMLIMKRPTIIMSILAWSVPPAC